MDWQVLIAHAKGEEHLAEKLAGPIQEAGYEVAHRGTVMVGESVTEEGTKTLSTDGPVVICGTFKAMGDAWVHRLVNAARQSSRTRVFVLQMEPGVYLEPLSLDGKVASYWQDPEESMQDLIASLGKYYPLNSDQAMLGDAEQRYQELALRTCDVIDLANLPESDRHIATGQLKLRRLYIPLRIRLEITSDTEAGEAKLKALKELRSAMQREVAPWGDRDEREDELNRAPVGHWLNIARRLVVLGDPGAGKTIMVRWIATAYLLRLKQDPAWKDLPDVATLPDEDWLPIIVRCRDIDQSCLSSSLDDVLRHTLHKAEMVEEEAIALQTVFRDKLDRGQALLLLDGLDEIAAPVLRARFCQQIEQIHLAYPDAPIIVTSRIVGYREMGFRIGRGFEHVTIADLSKEDKDNFASRWLDEQVRSKLLYLVRRK
jgi:hypothetical protein